MDLVFKHDTATAAEHQARRDVFDKSDWTVGCEMLDCTKPPMRSIDESASYFEKHIGAANHNNTYMINVVLSIVLMFSMHRSICDTMIEVLPGA